MNEQGCINLIGAVIKQAITDYAKGKTKRGLHEFISAKHFLFGNMVLENYLRTLGIESYISVDYIRRQAKDELCRNLGIKEYIDEV